MKAKVYHPDVDPSAKAREEFLKSKEAYQILSDVLERHEYDKLILGIFCYTSCANWDLHPVYPTLYKLKLFF